MFSNTSCRSLVLDQTTCSIGGCNRKHNYLPCSPDVCNKKTFHLFSQCNTHLTISMDNVGLEVGLLGTSSSMVTFIFYFFLM